MNKQQRADIINKKLGYLYKNPKPPLDFSNPFTLLIAVLLSAQCTDERVNIVTKDLFKKAKTPKAMVALGVHNIYAYIKTCGLAPKKSKAIMETSKILIEKHNSKVPNNLEELIKLPGVGHKTASVVLNQAFGEATFAVDTHIHRLAQRWKLTNGKNVQQTEIDLKRLFPKKDWGRLHLQIIFYGREFCEARKCYGLECKLCKTLFPNRKSKVITNKP